MSESVSLGRPTIERGAGTGEEMGEPARETTAHPHRETKDGAPRSDGLPLWQLNRLRLGYLVMGGGLAIVKWPLLVSHGPWELRDGTVQCMLVAMSVLALMGLRYPVRMLPVLLFEVGWKLTWLGVVAFPRWRDGTVDDAIAGQVALVAWVVLIIAAIPWRYVVRRYVRDAGDPWRRTG